MHLDQLWSFLPHFRKLIPKADRMACALARLLPNLGGPGAAVRRVYAAVTHSVLLYGAPVWAEEMDGSAQLRRITHGCQRRIASRIARAYRTVSFSAVTVLVGIPPIERLAAMYAEVYHWRRAFRAAGRKITSTRMEEARRRARAKALAGWRESLRDERLAGARTLDAIRPVFPAWIDRRHEQLSFHLTQILTGHGCFGAYLQRIGRERSARCHHCRRSVVDDA